MGIKNIIKNSLLKEVGEAEHQPFRSKRDYERSEKDDFNYVFKTKNGWKYTVSISREWGKSWFNQKQTEKEWREELASIYQYDRKKYVNLRKMGVGREDLRGIWVVGFSADEPDEPIEPVIGSDEEFERLVGSGDTRTSGRIDPTEGERTNWNDMMWNDWGGPSGPNRWRNQYADTNQGDFYRVMSTITKIIKDHIERHGGRLITFQPYDERRGRVFTHFIMKQMPGTKMWVDDNEFYFFLKVSKKK